MHYSLCCYSAHILSPIHFALVCCKRIVRIREKKNCANFAGNCLAFLFSSIFLSHDFSHSLQNAHSTKLPGNVFLYCLYSFCFRFNFFFSRCILFKSPDLYANAQSTRTAAAAIIILNMCKNGISTH